MDNKRLSLQRIFDRPIISLLAIGLAIRLLIMPFITFDYDIFHWGLVLQNIDSGNGLYDLDGYYYTPVWGYLLGFTSTVQQFLVDIGPTGIRFTEMFPLENAQYRGHDATLTTIAFNASMKIPLILCDIAVGYLIYYLIKEWTGDSKKATYGFALWFFCPVVIIMSASHVMFDNFSALLLLLVVIMFYKGKYFFGGMFFSMAVLLKFFPAFCIFVLIAYIIMKHKDDGKAKMKLIEAVSGAVMMTMILMLPMIINGQVMDAFYFVFDRVGSIYDTIFTVIKGIIVVIASVFFGYVMYRSTPEKAEVNLSMCIMLSVAASLAAFSMTLMAPQYLIVLIPFIIIHIIMADKRYMRCLILISVSATFAALLMGMNDLTLFASLSEYTSMLSPNVILDLFQHMENGIGIVIIFLLWHVAHILQFVGVVLLILFYFAETVNEKIPRLGKILTFLKGREDIHEE